MGFRSRWRQRSGEGCYGAAHQDVPELEPHGQGYVGQLLWLHTRPVEARDDEVAGVLLDGWHMSGDAWDPAVMRMPLARFLSAACALPAGRPLLPFQAAPAGACGFGAIDS